MGRKMSLSLLTSGTNHTNYSKENNQSAEEFIFYQVRHDLLKQVHDKENDADWQGPFLTVTDGVT